MYGIYLIYDLVAQAALGNLITFRHDAAAVRWFTDVASDPQTQVNRHLKDFELRRLGTFSEQRCYIIPADPEHDGFVTVLSGQQLLDVQAAAKPELVA